MGRHDIHTRRRAPGRHQAVADRQRLPVAHRKRADGERARASMAGGTGNARDEAD